MSENLTSTAAARAVQATLHGSDAIAFPKAGGAFSPLLTTYDWNEEWKALQRSRKAADDASYWDKRSATFGTKDAPNPYVDRFLELAGIRPGETVFDMGCGTGALTVPLARAGHRVIAADFSGGMLGVTRGLLDDAGIVDSDGDGFRELDGKKIDLRYVSYENRMLNDFSNAHMQYLAEIGIACTADFGSSDDQWSKLAAGEYDLNNNNWTTVGTGDPFEYMANWTTDGTYCGYSNPEYDALYEQLKGEMDTEKRADLIRQMQQIVIDDALVIVDGYYNSSMIYSKNVGFAHIHTADYYWLTTEIVPA